MNGAFWKAGYWISPADRWFRVSTHITEVCLAPHKFGLEQEALQRLFELHGEKYATEGAARERVIRSLVLHDWIRTRHYGNDGWTFNLARLDARSRLRVAAFLAKLHGGTKDYTPVRLDGPDGRETSDVARLLAGLPAPDGSGPRDGLPALIQISGPLEIPEEEVRLVPLDLTPPAP